LQLDLLDEAALLRLGRNVDALPGEVEFPAVIRAPQPAFLVAAEPERDTTVSTELVDQTVAAEAVAKRHQPFRQNFDPHWRAIVCGELFSEQHRQPVAPEQVAHRRTGTGLGDCFVLLLPQHRSSPGLWLLCATNRARCRPRLC